ncbi:universal stress protein [Halosimplex rubrum]|uniref:Universal stress protein n=1 Tax=Halosimplex rubrum TaxID=869889 RepID=A0A7D5P2P8_9EURY|nr:universal stress protein [Halosimplex rubrum]QLH77601.1 universal stress protein [Halosimplex rubrum]
MYESILAPTDGSATADLAADHALALAAAFDASVTALGVVDAAQAAGPFDAGGVDDEFLDRLETEARRSVDGVTERAGDVPVDGTVVEGDPAETIVDRAADHDLVVLGTHGRSAIDRVLTGSTSAQVVRESPAPVVTVRSDEGESAAGEESTAGDAEATDDESPLGYDDVLVPTDGSDAAEAAVDHGIAVAEAFDATVHAVNVVDVSAVAGGAGVAAGAGGAGTAGTVGSDLLQPMIENGEEATERVAERARAEGLDAVTDVGEGSPGSMLVDYVDEEDVDFVTMGTHGHTGLDRVLLGSTTERTMRNVSVPVLSVRASEDDGAE